MHFSLIKRKGFHASKVTDDMNVVNLVTVSTTPLIATMTHLVL